MSKKLELALRIRADLNQALDQLGELEDDLEGVGQQSKKTNTDMERLGATLGKLAGAVAGGVLFKAVIDATVEQERVTKQLEQTLKATGNAAGLNKDQLLTMAAGMQQVTTYGDEAVIGAQNLLLTFKEIGGDVFPRALEAVLDMSTTLGGDLKSSAIQLGKALNDPIKGVSALGEAGVQFTEQQRGTIKALVDSGRVADAQAIILAELEGQMGGTARAARDTLGGAISSLKNAFGDLLEGDAGGEGVKGATQSINELTNTLNDPAVKAGMQTMVSGILLVAEVAAKAAAKVAELTTAVGEGLAKALNGPALGDTKGITEAVRKQQEVVARLERRPQLGGGNTGPVRELEAEREKLRQLQQLLAVNNELEEQSARTRENSAAVQQAAAASEVASTAVLGAEAQKLLDNLKKQAETIGLISEEAKTRYAIESGELGDLIPEHQELLLTQARQLDQAKANAAASDEQRKATEKLVSAQLSFVANLERQASLIGLNTAQTREAEIAEKGLTGALLERAQAAAEMLAAEEERLAMEADAKTIAELQTQLLRAQGKESEAVALELEQRYGELMKRLQERADTAGVEIVKALINGEQARTELSGMQKELDRVFNDTSRREQTIQAQVNAGLITEGEARRRIVQEHQKQAKELENLLVLIEGFAEQTGNPAYLEEAERIRAELELLKYTADEVAIAFRDGLQGGLEESIMGLVDGTMSLRDALESLVLGIADSMARMASEQLADMATQRVLDLFNGGAAEQAQAIQQLTTQQVMSIQTVTNAQKTADIARATSSVAAANTAATGQAGAAATTTSAWAPAATTASIGSFGAAAAIGIAAVLAALAMAQSFNTGGQVRGAGTNTSDSIPAWLSDEEFITRAAVVKQPGALSFLEDFNQRGMTALDDWAGTVYHSTGGLAGTPAPAAPAPVFDGGRMSEESALTANVANNFRFAALFDIEEVASRLGSSPGFTDVLIQMTANNATAMQSALTT